MSAHLTPATSFVLIALTLLPGLTLGADPVVPLTLEEPLLSYHNSVGELDGVSVELVRELQRRVGNEKPIQVYPWARAYRIAQTRADILLFTTTRSVERDPLFHWLLRVNRDAWMLFARHDDDLQLNSLEGAKRVESVGVLRGGSHALLLRSEGFTNLEEVAYVEVGELLVIDGVDEGTAGELQARARDVLEAQNKAAMENARALGVEDSLVEFEGLTPFPHARER